MTTNKLISILALLVCAGCATGAAPAYPLKSAPGQHYMVDQNGKPFFVQGDSPWYLTEIVAPTDQDYYLSNRCAQGYNSIILDIAATPDNYNGSSETNLWGQLPFTNSIAGVYTNLLSWNLAYFTNVDWTIQRAASYGMCVFVYPMYDGSGGADWYSQMSGNPTTNLYQYGAFIGAHFKNFTNIVWIGAGDDDEPGTPGNCLWNFIAAGIASQDTNHLITAQPVRTEPATTYNFVNVNCTYPACFPYIQSLANYQQTPVLASFQREPYYETSQNICGVSLLTGINSRQFAYWAVLSGDDGFIFGSSMYYFINGWQSQVFSEASTTLPFVRQLMVSRVWTNVAPDANHTVVTRGYGTSGTIDYVACAREATGKTVLAYIPQDGLTPTVAMTNISGTTANAWWYNPSNGVAILIGSYGTTGAQTFKPPDLNDWVLVLDDASQSYPPPGQSSPQAPVIYVNLTNQWARIGSTVSLGVVVSGTPPLGFQWLFDGTNLTGAVSNPLVLSNVAPSSTGSYQVVITNSAGAAASYIGTLTVLVTNVLTIKESSGKLFQIALSGIPGQTYTIEYRTNVVSPWQTLGKATIDSSGTFIFYESVTSTTGFFRSTYP